MRYVWRRSAVRFIITLGRLRSSRPSRGDNQIGGGLWDARCPPSTPFPRSRRGPLRLPVSAVGVF